MKRWTCLSVFGLSGTSGRRGRGRSRLGSCGRSLSGGGGGGLGGGGRRSLGGGR